jgi:serine protease inhibitor
VDLPYADGFVMRLVLPAGNTAPDGTAASRDTPAPAAFDAEKLTEIADTFDTARPESVQIQLPRWDHRSSFDLRKVFGALGLENMLGTTEDFNNIQPQMMITQAAQAANITVAEKGTIAAAVTQTNGMATSAPPQPERTIEFDRPFHYQIVHGETGLHCSWELWPTPDERRGIGPPQPPSLTTLHQQMQEKPEPSRAQCKRVPEKRA